ncbi:hypothetical protein BC941DRAFT_417615 [Chlamydoabsidia padenii]|nr:hypothetical protein BC941DRAFT_417615 [Chlamydoabsidia padenii]
MLLSPSRSTLMTATTTTRFLLTRCAFINKTPLSVNSWRTIPTTINTFHHQNQQCKRYFSQNTGHLQPDEYELRIGYAITILQDELPQFFNQGLKAHDIYSQHVVLSDPHYTRLSIKGKTAYLGIAEMLRWSLGCYFDKVDFEIIRMRVVPDKPSDPTSPPPPPPPITPTSSTTLNYNSSSTTYRPSSNVRSLEIRWQLKATPHTFLPKYITHSDDNSIIRQVDGVFVYTFDNQGYICEHKIQRIEPTPSKTILLMHSYGGRLRAFLEALKRRNEPELRPGLGI